MKKLTIILFFVFIPNFVNALPKCEVVYYETYRSTKVFGGGDANNVNVSSTDVICATVTIRNTVGSVFLEGTTIITTDVNGKTRTKTLGTKRRLKGGETYTTNTCGKAPIEKIECKF